MNTRLLAILLLILAGGFAMTAWAIPEINRRKAQPYLAAFRDAEIKYGLPPDLLNRVAWQESRYDKDAVSPVGAIGLMQFMPATAAELGIDPHDPFLSITAAGIYLRRLYGMFGSWTAAVAAYNFGAGNVKKNIAKYGTFNIAALPLETRNYLSIVKDIGVA